MPERRAKTELEHSVNELKAFRYIALAEATSFLLLLVATLVKYTADAPAGVKVLGPVHGTLFLVYVVLAIVVRSALQWSLPKTLLVLLGAVIPFGGYVVDRKVLPATLTPTGSPATR